MNQFALPIFLNRKNKYFFSALWVAAGAVLYLGSNHFPLRPAQLLPMTSWDLAIPFLPWTVWIYASEIFLYFAVYIFSRDLVNANKYLYSIFFLQTSSVIIFWLWPTVYPREQFPIPPNTALWTADALRDLRNVDTPVNCLPSLHVSSCFLSSFVYLDEQREKFAFFLIWSIAIAGSTLTTKQHYLIDVIAGIGMAVVVYLIFHRLLPYRKALPLSVLTE